MKPDESTRTNIDQMLNRAGWTLADMDKFDLQAAVGVAIRDFRTKKDGADYLLLVEGKVMGVIEAKPSGAILEEASLQGARYVHGIPDDIPHPEGPIPFTYKSNGIKTYFRDEGDPDPYFRRIFSVHRPETLKYLHGLEVRVRSRLKKMPALVPAGLRIFQQDAVTRLEASLSGNKPRSLIQMASGTGKTLTALHVIYRLLKFAGARRILFLADHTDLTEKVFRDIQKFVFPGEEKEFSQVFKVQHLAGDQFDPDSAVCITTGRRLFALLEGEDTPKSRSNGKSSPEDHGDTEYSVKVPYHRQIPPETFDFIVLDECNPAIFTEKCEVWQYFDAFLIGLTAVPLKETLEFFNQNLVSDYSYLRAVADGICLGHEVYQLKRESGRESPPLNLEFYLDKRNVLTRAQYWDQTVAWLGDLKEPGELDFSSLEQVTEFVITFKNILFTQLFPRRSEIPKTLIFARDADQSEMITRRILKEFAIDQKICRNLSPPAGTETYRDTISNFCQTRYPRILITVDRLAAGVNIPPLECLVFFQRIKSLSRFTQMKGRGCRSMAAKDFNQITPDAKYKTHYVIIDAAGIWEKDGTDFRPLERKKNVPLEKLITHVTAGRPDEDVLISLAGRLAAITQQLEDADRVRLNGILKGRPLSEIINHLLDAVDPDIKIRKAKEVFGTDTPSEQQIKPAIKQIIVKACSSFNNSEFKNILLEIANREYRVIPPESDDMIGAEDLTPAVEEEASVEAGVPVLSAEGKAAEERIDETPPEEIEVEVEEASPVPLEEASVEAEEPVLSAEGKAAGKGGERKVVLEKEGEKTAGFDPESIVDKFIQFLEDQRERLMFQGIIYRNPGFERKLSLDQIENLSETLKKPPYNLSIDLLWKAFAELENSKVQGTLSSRILTDFISLIHFAMGITAELKPFSQTVNEKFDRWMVDQEETGEQFSIEQLEWLQAFKDHIIHFLSFEMEALNLDSFRERGGALKAFELFGNRLNGIIDQLNKRLVL